MIYEFTVRSTELTLTPNEDGSHTLRVVQAGGEPLEFTCDLRPQLTAQVTLNEGVRIVNLRGEKETIYGDVELTLLLTGAVKKGAANRPWRMRVLARDDCGRPRAEAHGEDST